MVQYRFKKQLFLPKQQQQHHRYSLSVEKPERLKVSMKYQRGGARGSCVLTAACVTVMCPVLTPFLTLLPLLPCLLRSSPTCLLDAPVVGQVRSCALVFAHPFPFAISCSFPSDLPDAPLNSRSCSFQKQHSLLPHGLL